MNKQRFEVQEGSESGHCCFEATVVDNERKHPTYRDSADWICECFEVRDAQRISEGLNLLVEIENWLVCAAIATPEDMAKSFEHFQQRIATVLREGEQQ